MAPADPLPRTLATGPPAPYGKLPTLGDVMKATLTLDDDLVTAAKEYTGIADMPELMREALTALVQREAARRLARLGGTEPGLRIPRRRRPAA